MSVHDLDRLRRSRMNAHLVDLPGASPPPPRHSLVGPTPLRPDSWPTLASLARKARPTLRDEAPKAPSRGSPSVAGGEFAGFARKEEAARLKILHKVAQP